MDIFTTNLQYHLLKMSIKAKVISIKVPDFGPHTRNIRRTS